MVRFPDISIFIGGGDVEGNLLSPDFRHRGGDGDSMPRQGGSFVDEGNEPPTVVSWTERKGARAFTAASSMAADSTGVASTGRDPLFTFSAVSSSVMVLVICAVIPLIIMIMLLCANACYQPL